jgi:hypothetical protein
MVLLMMANRVESISWITVGSSSYTILVELRRSNFDYQDLVLIEEVTPDPVLF